MSLIPACVFAKPPIPGRVKTRLAASIGADSAARLAAAMLQDVWSVVSRSPHLRPVLATVEPGDFPIAVPAQSVWLQQGVDLGARITSIFERALESAPAALAIGADSPGLSNDHLQLAASALQTHDSVLGPCPDGGFYLLGLRRCPAGLLEDIPWSTSETSAVTLDRLRQHRFSIFELPPLFDIDTLDDLATLGAALSHDPLAAPLTRSWYAAHSAAVTL